MWTISRYRALPESSSPMNPEQLHLRVAAIISWLLNDQ
jgi:hypothetical protein